MRLAVLGLAALLAAAVPRAPAGFTIQRIATVPGARELAVAPDGDLFVGTSGQTVEIVPHAEGNAGTPAVYATFPDAPAAGVALNGPTLYVGTQFGVWRVPYRAGALHAPSAPKRLARVRTSGISEDHVTTSVAVSKGVIYASVGSNCNACWPVADPSRATIGTVSGGRYHPVAVQIRNAIALAVNPANGALWAGVAGEDDLPVGHPYEIFDDVTRHAFPANYGWPFCYENHRENPVPQWHGHDCTNTVVPLVVFPAYETPIGAAFYPLHPRGWYAFPARYWGGAFVALHGSWHGPAQGLPGFVPPRVVFVPMRGGGPAIPVDWNDPNRQWQPFLRGYQEQSSDQRIGRPTGIAVGPQGDLFVADDLTGAIYRIRPG